MASNSKGTLIVIVQNIRDAGVNFGKRFTPPVSNIRTEVTKLLSELGINDPAGSVTNALEGVATDWKKISDSLSAVSLDFTNPAEVISGLEGKINTIKSAFSDILHKPDQALNGLGASATAIKTVLPKRLLDYIIYDFITKSHEKIGGVFLLLGVLRREFMSAGGNPAFVDAEIRVFDLPQLIKMLTHPKEAFLTVMRWGKDDFKARPIVDGMALLLGLIPGINKGPEDAVFPFSEETKFVGPLPLPDPNFKESALRDLITPTGTISFVGLHRHGIGLKVPNPVNISGGLGSIEIPKLPSSEIFALTPGNIPESDPPIFKVIP
jgi:hypothetical protein